MIQGTSTAQMTAARENSSHRTPSDEDSLKKLPAWLEECSPFKSRIEKGDLPMENTLQERDLDELPAYSRNDVAFLEKSVPTVRHREDGMLEFALPFADESDPVFAATKVVARSRTRHTLDDLRRKNPIMFQSSLAKFAKNVQVENPRFIPVSPRDRKRADGDGKVYWIPLFSVWQKDKARIVFDAKASNGKGTCLNDKLLQGPDRNN